MNTQPNYIDIADIIAEIESAEIVPSFEEIDTTYFDETNDIEIAVGYICNTIKTERFEFSYEENYSHPVNDPTEVTTSDAMEPWQLYGIYPRVVVDNGEIVPDYDLEQIVAEFTEIQEMDAAITLVMNQPAR